MMFVAPGQKTPTPVFMIVDGHALIYRAYHAFPELTDPTGRLVNAVYGFTRILLTAIRDLHPEYLTVAFDHKGPTKRASELYADYKAQRPAMPDDLKPQIGLVKDVVDALTIPRFELEGYEADDLIGTICQLMTTSPHSIAEDVPHHDQIKTVIVTGDKDLFQLIDDDKVHVWLPARGKGKIDEEIDEEGVARIMGVKPTQVVDLKALMGDSSDNIPGVKGIGPKTAIDLIGRYQTLDGVYAAVDRLSKADLATLKVESVSPKLLEKLMTDQKMAYLSQELATIQRDVQIKFQLAPCRIAEYDKDATTKIFNDLGFKSLLHLLPKDDFELGVQSALF